MVIHEYVLEKAKISKSASRILANIETEIKNNALNYMAVELLKYKDDILKENYFDIEEGRKNNLSKPFLDRLLLNDKRITDMANGLKSIAKLTDPLGETIKAWKQPNGLEISQVRVPLGVIGIIYEARPNVTVDAVALCIKSGNAVILRGGSEAIHSNAIIADILSKAAISSGLPNGTIQFMDILDREVVTEMMKLNEYIDVLIPRGGAGLINAVVKNSTVPVIQTGVGNCHVYVDYNADMDMAESIIINAKTQRPAVCNAMETLLVHQDIAKVFLPKLCKHLSDLNVEIRGCRKTQSLLGNIINVIPACEEDYSQEFLDLILAVKVVSDIDEAIDHIYKYGTKHSEAIITNDYKNSQRFLNVVDAAAVYVNASTRFTDGYEFGFGGEIGISTQKLHARGPMGLKELTTIKYKILGDGQIRA
jgi:glutamate-5-semialdehyde dehydrogenase